MRKPLFKFYAGVSLEVVSFGCSPPSAGCSPPSAGCSPACSVESVASAASSFLPPQEVKTVAEKKANSMKLATVNFTFFIESMVSVALSY